MEERTRYSKLNIIPNQNWKKLKEDFKISAFYKRNSFNFKQNNE